MLEHVELAIRLLMHAARFREGMCVEELARAVECEATLAQQVLDVLKQHGLLMLNETRERYQVGYRMVSLAQHVDMYHELHRFIQPYLESLLHRMGETVNICALIQGQVMMIGARSPELYMAHFEAFPKMLPRPLNQATGKVLLAYSDPAFQEVFVKTQFESEDKPRKYKDENEALADLESIRDQGFAENMGELLPYLIAVAVPIFDGRGSIWMTLGMSAPSVRFNRKRRQEALSIMLPMAMTMSEKGCDSLSGASAEA